MRKRKRNERGFARRRLLTGGALVVVAVVAGLMVLPGPRQMLLNKLTAPLKSEAEKVGIQLGGGSCSGKGPGKLTHSAMNASDFSMIIPYGLMVGGHVTPIDHQYYAPAAYDSPRDAYPVYAMGDARLVSIEHRTEQPQDNAHTRATATSEYRLIFSMSCTSYYYYDLLTSLSPKLTAAVGSKQNASVDIAVKAGEQIGAIGGQTLDFAVWDTEKPLKGFAVPKHYEGEPWKLYVADPLDYESADVKQLMLSRYPRTAEPLSGKLDWDVDGALRGTWFLEGSGYLEGDRQNPKGPWVGHLSFSPDLYDPSRWVVSMGDYPVAQDERTQVSATQLYARVGSPDPASVTAGLGLVKIELVHERYRKADGTEWDQRSFTKGPVVSTSGESHVAAVALVQLTDARTLKFEVFVGKTAAQVSGFDGGAKVFTR